MVDFNKTETDIKNYIKTSFDTYLEKFGIAIPSDYVDDVLDLDVYTKNTTVFYDFDSIDFSTESFETQNQKLTLEICIVCRNGKSSDLRQKSRDYATAFYNWFYDKPCNRNFEGIIDWGTIDSVTFYDAVSGTKTIKIANLTLTLNLDD